MSDTWDFERYEAFAVRAAADLMVPLVDSLEDAKSGWGLRRLSPADFDELKARAMIDSELHGRWSDFLQIGYDRTKSKMVTDIEEIFADIPCVVLHDDNRQEDAA